MCGKASAGVDRLDPRFTYCNPRTGGCGARRSRDTREEAVRSIIAKRRIERLVHVTQVGNLKSIFGRGLIPRSQHLEFGIEAACVDRYRRDGMGQTNLSITYGNRWMLGDLVKETPENWVLLAIDPGVLGAPDDDSVQFHQTNAATMEHRSGPTPADLEAMFDATVTYRTSKGPRTIERDGRDASLPTDDQAEITVNAVILASSILAVWFATPQALDGFVRLRGPVAVPACHRGLSEWWRSEH